jgi:hypothetical protein
MRSDYDKENIFPPLQVLKDEERSGWPDQAPGLMFIFT